MRTAVSQTPVLAWSLQLSPLLTSSPLYSLLPASCLAHIKVHRVALQVSQAGSWLSFPGAVQLLGWHVPSLSLQCTLTSLLLMQLAGTGVQRAWLGCTSLTAQGFGVFSSQGCLYKWICYYYKSAVFKRYYPKHKQHQCNLLNLPWSIDVGGVKTANN